MGAVGNPQSRRSLARRSTKNVIVADAVRDSPSQKFTNAVVGAVEKPSARLEPLYWNSDVFVVGAVGNPLSSMLRDIFGHVCVVGAVDKPSERDAQRRRCGCRRKTLRHLPLPYTLEISG